MRSAEPSSASASASPCPARPTPSVLPSDGSEEDTDANATKCDEFRPNSAGAGMAEVSLSAPRP
eukprot:CAMPEP_0172767942 /NCGR_PEP_ID=MMETSP1074-20121228/183808_1 /TAXON_ID=2916 /ORGANISM="Ceratium fusus, Strain PA161109" /LENGTH=63 /DNA_ID=CAMNT_0013603267 /DNA_START=59 /DNA_END=250 /DNA_ORIENTATION=-